MKYKNKYLAIAVAGTLGMCVTTSCFKEEPLNAECDIERIAIRVDEPEKFFFQLTDTARSVNYADSEIFIDVRGAADISAVALHFNLTEGATVTPASGSVQNFSAGPVTYTVTSQDGKWHRDYSISLRNVWVTVQDTVKYDFEHYELNSTGKYYVWHNVLPDGSLGNDWASGNPGYGMSKGSAKADEYVTVPEPNGYDGACVKLTTRDTGPLGKMMSLPIAAGNLFIGEFDLTYATKETLKATLFGKPFTDRPVKYTGYYKYKRGPVFTNKKFKEEPGRQDIGDIYSVLYLNHDAQGNAFVLHGDDVLSSPQIVAIARVKDLHETSEWTYFEVEYEYSKEIDEALLAERGYSLTVVFSSSRDGAAFEGAVGSELMVDKVRVISAREE